jgi:hypothetical protein
MRQGRVFWAVVLILLGFMFLATNLGIFNINVWRLFWPVFLILLGVWFLLGNVLGTGKMVMEEESVELGEAESASIIIKHGAGRLSLRGSASTGKLVEGKFANGLDANLKREGGRIQAVLQPESRAFPEMFFPGNWISGKGLSWDFSLTKEIPLDLVFEIGAVDARLDLSELQVKDLVIKTGASSTTVQLPTGAGLTHVKVEAGAASLVLEVPEGVAARIESESGLASISIDQNRFPKINGVYQSSDYESTPNKVDIRLESGVASIEIR